jgi:disulfide bond formation protein DsbB
MPTNRYAAPLVALLAPLLLYGGALVSQYGFGLYPCEMCYWQRWPHQAAMLLAAIAIAISGLIGIFHAGVEYGFWEGLTTCSTGQSGPVSLDDIMAAPLIRCDVPQWTLFGVSLAGFNAILSLAASALVLTLLRRRPTPAA